MLKPVSKAIALIIVVAIFLTGCGTKELQSFQKDEFVLGTRGQIRVFSTSQRRGNATIGKAFTRIREIENTMSTSIEGSDVYRINKNAGKSPVQVDPETLKLIKMGIEYEEITGGVFNIVLGSLIDLWGIGKDWQKVPPQQEIEEAKRHININDLEIIDSSVFIRDSKMLMDLGGIAKGYAVDEAVRVLKNDGVESGFINLGGDIYALGNKPDGTPWNVGIQNPIIGKTNAIARIALADQSIVSSGDYERYFIEDDQHYHHIIDPETGYPSTNELVSVTIVSETATDGDVLSTAAFVMGLEDGLSFIESLENIEAVFITRDRIVYTTSGIKDKLEILDDLFTIAN
ncbi:FAD:protein FMN transferase [Alkaliphilus peptidifermentans]|uniref:FAD:protein FMN transferase n=1 Tax=Alkaliphilus peptidifermentans DSM 18978 TaxID=1120976 RepID=A0A1G5HPP0_9FIRM|nr:FAD:protein FMN transferase [Alkaliphilus peptidifermentans]SCY65845.1 thiamine biosynthesis lipoprotein [Alkaliphilus peptidifermentans DSM 18978]